jgi:YVTN family beta-propeller protein
MKTVLSILCLSLVHVIADERLTLKATIPVPDAAGRFDHFAIDSNGQRLFIAALGNNTVEVISVSNNSRIKSITGLRKPCGIAFLPEKNQIAVAAGGEGLLKVFSGEDYKPIATVPGLDDADNVRFQPQKDSLFIGYGDGALAIVDVKRWKKTGDIKLAGHPESFQVDESGDTTYVNVPGAKEVAVVDAQERRLRATFSMTRFTSNFPMALDAMNKRLFVGCRTPPRLIVLDTESGRELRNVEISGDTDDLFYDAKRQCAYISCGEGFIDVVTAAPKQPLKRIQQIPTRPGARTSFFSSDLDRFFLAAPTRGADPAELRIYAPRP